MRIKVAATAISLAALTLTACGQADTSAPAAEAPAPVVETPQDRVAKLAASMSPQDFKLREIQCLGALSLAKMDIDDLPQELAAQVEATARMDFLANVRQARELGLESTQINKWQHDQMPRLLKPEDITPEYTANLKECLDVAAVANARDGVTQ